MILTYDESLKRFVWSLTYGEHQHYNARQHGFFWDRDNKVWHTADPLDAKLMLERMNAGEDELVKPDDVARSKLAKMTEHLSASSDASRKTDAVIDTPAPPGLAYMPFQKAGIEYASSRPNTLFADDMGLGKTIQAIGVINGDTSVRKVLVLCPASLKINWKRELKKWLTRPFSIGIAEGRRAPRCDVLIMNYDILANFEAAIRRREWDVLIIDECHFLKNSRTKRARHVFGYAPRPADVKKAAAKGKELKPISPIPAMRVLALTGTPICNRPSELFPIINYLDPGRWSDFFSYAKEYCAASRNSFGWDFSGSSNLDKLQNILRSTIMLRRLKKDVLVDLPAKVRQVIEVPPPPGAEDLVSEELLAWEGHEDQIADLRADVELAKAGENDGDYRDAVDRLKRAMSARFEEMAALRHATAVAKIPVVIEHVRGVLENEQGKVAVWAHHHEVVDALFEAFPGSVKVDGRMDKESRQRSVDAFQEDESVKVFIGSIHAAGVGLTLTAGSTAVFAELDWVPGNISQAEDRHHRIGQKDSVLIQHIVMEGSLDARMAKTIVNKQRVIDEALDKMEDIEPVNPYENPEEPKSSRKELQKVGAKLPLPTCPGS